MGKRGGRMIRKSANKMRFELDTIGYMPERFITAYFELVRLGLKIEPNAQQFDNESGTVKKKYRTPDGGLRDEEALRFKAWADRQIRAIGRDIQAYLNAREGNSRIATGKDGEALRVLGHEIAKEMEQKAELKCKSKTCGQYVSWQWTFCAWCGTRVPGHPAERVPDEQTVVRGGEGS